MLVNPYIFAAGGGEPAPGDPEWSNVVLRIPADGASIVDESNSAHTLTPRGTPTIDSAQSKWGGSSIRFDSAGNDGFSTPNDADFGFGTGDFTAECWVRFDTTVTNTTGAIFITNFVSGSNFGLKASSSGKLLLFLNNVFGGYAGPTTMLPDTWYHVALVRASGVCKSYLGGVEQASVAHTTDLGASRLVAFGYETATYGNRLNGWIDDIRITKGVARYTANFTPPTEALPTS